MTIETDRAATGLDSVDRFLESWEEDVPEPDLVAEGIVDRILTLTKYLKRSADETFAEFDLNHGRKCSRCGAAASRTAAHPAGWPST